MSHPHRKLTTPDKPHEVWIGHGPNAGCTWKVLRKYQFNDDKPFARWHCHVSTPQLPEGELGDVYVSDIKPNATLSHFAA